MKEERAVANAAAEMKAQEVTRAAAAANAEKAEEETRAAAAAIAEKNEKMEEIRRAAAATMCFAWFCLFAFAYIHTYIH